jgi:hypothetical protein
VIQITLNTLAYLVLLFALCHDGKARPVATVLALNWLICTLLQTANGNFAPLPSFIIVDFLSGVMLAGVIGGKLAGRTAILFLPMIGISVIGYMRGGNDPSWRGSVADVLAWLQLGIVFWGAWGDGLVSVVDNTLRRSHARNAAPANRDTGEGA